MAVGFKCPFCKSSKVWKKGVVPSIHGKKTRYICFDCGKSFYKPAEPAKKKITRKKAG